MVMPKRIEQKLLVHIGKSEYEASNSKDLIMCSRYCWS